MNEPGIVVATTVSAELEHLAAELDNRGLLRGYVHPFLYLDERPWQVLTRAPRVGSRVRYHLEKRRPRANVHPSRISQGAALSEVLRALGAGRSVRLDTALLKSRNRSVARRATKEAEHAQIVVASSGPAFRLFTEKPHVFKVLNHPTVHPQYRTAVIEQEAGLHPSLAWTMERDRPSQLSLEQYRAELRMADLILVGSHFARETLIEAGSVAPSKVAVVPYGTDLPTRPPTPGIQKRAPFKILYVGRITQAKGLSYLLDAASRFADTDVTLTLVGGSQQAGERLRSQYPNLFEHVPNRNKEELERYFETASILVLPTLFDGLGMVAIEAQARGVPVIVSDRGPDEVVVDKVTGFVVKSASVDEIVSRIRTIREMPEAAYAAMVHASRRNGMRYSWSNYSTRAAEQILTAYSAARAASAAPR